MRGRRRGGPVARQGPDEAHELGVVQRVDDEALVGRIHGQAVEDLLVVDELRPGSRHALDHEIELVGSALDAVVVDRHAQVLAAARLARLEAQDLSAPRGNVERGASRAIGDTNDDGRLAAVPEEMLHGQRDEAERSVAAEDAAELLEAFHGHGLVQRPALRAPDERYDGGGNDRNDVCAVLDPWLRRS